MTMVIYDIKNYYSKITSNQDFTISFIIISVGPNFRWTRNTSRNLRYMTRRDRENIRLAIVNVSDG